MKDRGIYFAIDSTDSLEEKKYRQIKRIVDMTEDEFHEEFD